jgi:hypothetical protein
LPAADQAYDSAVEKITSTLPLYDRQHTVELRAINNVGAVSPSIKQRVTVSGVGAQPAYTADVPKLSNNATITPTLTAPAGASAQISQDPFFGGATWMPATEQATLQLGMADGPYSIYVRFRDEQGIESPVIARSLTLDRAAPTGRALLHGSAAPQLEIQAEDDGSGVTAVQIGDVATPGVWQPFQTSLAVPQGLANLQIRLRDAAGNVSAPITVQRAERIYLPLVVRA